MDLLNQQGSKQNLSYSDGWMQRPQLVCCYMMMTYFSLAKQHRHLAIKKALWSVCVSKVGGAKESRLRRWDRQDRAGIQGPDGRVHAWGCQQEPTACWCYTGPAGGAVSVANHFIVHCATLVFTIKCLFLIQVRNIRVYYCYYCYYYLNCCSCFGCCNECECENGNESITVQIKQLLLSRANCGQPCLFLNHLAGRLSQTLPCANLLLRVLHSGNRLPAEEEQTVSGTISQVHLTRVLF